VLSGDTTKMMMARGEKRMMRQDKTRKLDEDDRRKETYTSKIIRKTIAERKKLV
jgi:hypothetical protein